MWFKIIISAMYLLLGYFAFFVVIVLLFGFFTEPKISSQIVGYIIIYVYFFSYVFMISKKTKKFYRGFSYCSLAYIILVLILLSPKMYTNYLDKKDPYRHEPEIIQQTIAIESLKDIFNPENSWVSEENYEAYFEEINNPDELVKQLPQLPHSLSYYNIQDFENSYIYDKNKSFVSCYGISKTCFERLGYQNYNEALLEFRKDLFDRSILEDLNENHYVEKYDWEYMFSIDIQKYPIQFSEEYEQLNAFLSENFYIDLYIKMNESTMVEDIERLQLNRYLGAAGIAIIETPESSYVYFLSSNSLGHTNYAYSLAEILKKDNKYIAIKNPADEKQFSPEEKDDLYVTIFYEILTTVEGYYDRKKEEMVNEYELTGVQRRKGNIDIYVHNLNNYPHDKVIAEIGEYVKMFKLPEFNYNLFLTDKNETNQTFIAKL